MFMARISFWLGLLAITTLTGCLPQECIVWAPDGHAALLIGDKGVFLTDAQGNVSPLASDIATANWMHDSKRLVVARKTILTAWKDVAALLPASRQQEIIAIAPAVLNDLKASAPSDSNFSAKSLKDGGESDLPLVLLYLRDIAKPDLGRQDTPAAKALADAKVSVFHVSICDAGASDKPGPTLATVLHLCVSLASSPNDKAVSFIGPLPDQPADRLCLVAVGVGRTQGSFIADKASTTSYAWSPDSRHLVYAATLADSNNGGSPGLATVRRTQVLDESGQFIPADKLVGEDLAIVFHDAETKVAYLPTGQILFCACDVQLPAASQDFSTSKTVFMVDPALPASVTRILPKPAMAEIRSKTPHFVPSPNGKYLLVTDPEGEQSFVFSLSTGKCERVIEHGEGEFDTTMPAWRGNSEICFVSPAGSRWCDEGVAQVMLMKITPDGKAGEAGSLSRKWPREARATVLQDPTTEETPTSSPATAETEPEPAR